ncbi:MAG: hypothetical protein WD851_06240 [Pirellulales bacterium]
MNSHLDAAALPLSLFNHRKLKHYRETSEGADHFGHAFGGGFTSSGLRIVNADFPIHLLYRLNLDDPAFDIEIPGVKWLPLCYRFVPLTGDTLYRVVSDTEIELISPIDEEADPAFPYPGFPSTFPSRSIAFARQPYDPTNAEDALSLLTVFGLDQLSPDEMKLAIKIAKETGELCDKHDVNLTDEEHLKSGGNWPFLQGAPTTSCNNPLCSAEVEWITEELELVFPEELHDVTGPEPLILPGGAVIRESSLRVFGLYQPNEGDTMMWGDPYVQMIFQICDCCQCICVSNQCT